MQSVSWGPGEACTSGIAVDIQSLITAPALRYTLERNKSWHYVADVPTDFLCLYQRCFRISESWHLRNKPLVCHSYLIYPTTKVRNTRFPRRSLCLHPSHKRGPPRNQLPHSHSVASEIFTSICQQLQETLLSRKSSVSKVHGYGLDDRDSIPGNGSDLSLHPSRCSGRFWVPTIRVPMHTRGAWDWSLTIYVMSKFRMCGTLLHHV